MPNQDSPPPLRSALASCHANESSAGGAALSLQERPLGRLWQLAGWGDFADAAAPVLNALALSELGDYRRVQESDSGNVLGYRIAPDKVWLRGGDDATALDDAIKQSDAQRLAALELSHSRCVISVRGAACEEVMARVAALDFSIAAFPAGAFAQTGVHQVGVLIHRAQHDRFDVLTPLSWARSTWEWLWINASPYLD